MGNFRVNPALAVPENASILGDSTPNAIRMTKTQNRSKNTGFIFNGDANLRHEPAYFVKIYNLAEFEHRVERPWVHPQRLGNLIVIPACQPGQPYSTPFTLPDIVQMRTERPGSPEIGVRGVDGKFLAQDAIHPDDPQGNWKTMREIAAGAAVNEGTNLYKFGVFWTINDEPTPEELHMARTRLEKTYNELIDEAGLLALEGARGMSQIGHLHRRAANYFGVDVEWNRRFHRKVQCPECGAPNVETASVCKECPMVFSWEKALANGLRTKEQAVAAGVMSEQAANFAGGAPTPAAGTSSPKPKSKPRAKPAPKAKG